MFHTHTAHNHAQQDNKIACEKENVKIGKMAAVDTHLFMNGEASEKEYERLLELSARSCYLHATLATPLEPKVEICLNGNFIS